MKLFECVPNISVGSDRDLVQFIQTRLRAVQGVSLLHVDSSAEVDRTVFTFVGEADAVREAILTLAKLSFQYIDLSQGGRVHPRIGALDVCPVVPLAGATMEEAVQLIRSAGEAVASELDVPIFLYGFAASTPERFNLEDVRRGQYEALRSRFFSGESPDFGPAEFISAYGASVFGARKLLVAFNLNLETEDVRVARKIAACIRTSGSKEKPGLLQACKAIGWVLPTTGAVQVSTNIIDFTITGIHEVYAAIEHEAKALGTVVRSSELIGLVPEQAMCGAAAALGVQGTTEEQVLRVGDILQIEDFGAERVLEWAVRGVYPNYS